MALENLISISFTEVELKEINKALDAIQEVLKGKVINLTPEQRQQYGSIAEQNKLFVEKAKFYMEMYPQYLPSFVSKKEFDMDYTARQQMAVPAARMAGLSEQMGDTKILLDHDNYFNALTFYRNIRFLSNENVPGMTSVFEDMKQFFLADPKPADKKKKEENKDTPATPDTPQE